MKVSLIAAASSNRVIGIGDDLPWKLPADMKFFKETTSGHHILMGRKTWEILGKALPNRVSIVVSGQKLNLPANVFGFETVEKAIEFAAQNGETELMVIGGGKLYEAVIPIADRIYLTHVYTKVKNGTAFFPPVSELDWKIVSLNSKPKDESNQFDMDFMILEKKPDSERQAFLIKRS